MDESPLRAFRAELLGEHLHQHCVRALLDEVNERFDAEHVLEVERELVVTVAELNACP